ncbi:DUF4817 domain-containing protein [Trichonephila clavipes]|nr:DUF4817 domain-containing protein [Trichonephila clavipes]
MSSMQEKVYCVFEYAKTSSVTVEQRHFRTKFRKEPPHRHNISRCVKQFLDTGCLCKNKSPGRKETKPEVIEKIRDLLRRNPSRRAGCRIGGPSHNGVARLMEASPIQAVQLS